MAERLHALLVPFQGLVQPDLALFEIVNDPFELIECFFERGVCTRIVGRWNGSLSHPYAPLFPLDGRGRLRADVIDHAVDAVDLVDDPRGKCGQ